MSASENEILDEIVRLRRRLEEAKRTVVCAPAREEWLTQALEAAGLADTVRVVTSDFIEGTDVYVINHLDIFSSVDRDLQSNSGLGF